jgi:quercetin dioxygenase-like cupin family protein
MSWLLKMSADTTLSAHSHDDFDEECLVMQGSIRLGGKTLFEGDYTVAVKGTTHQDVYSETGCVLFLKSPASHEKDLMALC